MSTALHQPITDSIREIALKYQVDLHDPMFSVLEKMDQYHQSLLEQVSTSALNEKHTIELLNQTLELRISEIKQAMENLALASSNFNSDAKLISESTAGLEYYWRQIHWYHALTGTFVTLLLCSIGFGSFFYHSADRKLSLAGVTLKSEPFDRVTRLTLAGKRITASARSESEVVTEFAK